MLKILSSISILCLSMGIFGFASAQESGSPFDHLDVITADNVTNLEQVEEINFGTGLIRYLSWSSDGTQLAVVRQVDNGRTVEIWELETITFSQAPTTTLIPEAVDYIHWLPDNQSVVTHGQYPTDNGVQFIVQKWDINTSTVMETLVNENVALVENYVRVVPPILGWNNDYTQYVFAVDNDTIQFSNGSIYTVENGFGVIYWADWSPDDLYLALLFGGSDTYRFQIVDVQTLASVLDALGSDYYVSDMLWSPDSLTVAVASVWANPFSPFVNVRFYRIGEEVRYGRGEVILSADLPDDRDYGAGRQRGVLSPPPGMTWSLSTAIIAISFPTAVSFYETETFAELTTIDESQTMTLDWHPSGTLIATGNLNGTIRLWGIPVS